MTAVDRPDVTRLERFAADVAALQPDPAAKRRLVTGTRLGGALLVAGIAIGVVAYLLSHRTTSSLTQGDAIVVAGIGVSVSIAGAAIYLRYGLSQFLRLWLARLVYENARARSDAGVGPDRDVT